jgi:hypothetical protein
MRICDPDRFEPEVNLSATVFRPEWNQTGLTVLDDTVAYDAKPRLREGNTAEASASRRQHRRSLGFAKATPQMLGPSFSSFRPGGVQD